MGSFIIGAGTAIGLAIGTFFVLEFATISVIEKSYNPSLNLEGVHIQYPGVERVNPAERVAEDEE
ncbi:hypothetical protein [Profundibacterium mesophilum]|uniref:Uncharacterized protein n=1 Tax=Profundibacterium mesophilum KAUST100406-0324 TaxID=1037889 RepID=A0A921NV23_9RHOB|nr:hypothetical protein [Profundibacterium mesophilum]KAF0676030.1 hypothetical protein PMES_01594 [Profundibacterium mesophilum KAUST100406-0324]